MSKIDKQPILSICIPTYNRCSLLNNTLKKITSQPYFQQTDNVEIAISDNCSTDETPAVCEKYKNLFPNKIFYHRNDENIKDRNFEKVLSLANGLYLKLCNDTIVFKPNSLESMCEDILKFVDEKPLLCFAAGFVPSENRYEYCQNISDFVSKISYGITAIGTFGIWKSDFDNLTDFNKSVKKQLAQTDVVLELASQKQSVIITPLYFENIICSKKGGYNIAEVFGKNYLSILKSYIGRNKLSKRVCNKEKKKILTRFINNFYFDFENRFNFKKDGYFKFLASDYAFNLYFWTSLLKLLPKIIKQHFHNKRVERQVAKGNVNILWRDLNRHNETTVSKFTKIDHLSVGNYSYGNITMFHSGNGSEKLEIGNFCSIAPEVTFLLASEHNYKTVSTYPFKVKFLGEENEALSKGSITVGDDVWIGYGATIFSGIKIGQGAIIGAGSIVTKDVPPYAIVAGNPAKVLKYRFSDEVIAKLLEIDYSTLSREKIVELSTKLYTELTPQNIDQIIADF